MLWQLQGAGASSVRGIVQIVHGMAEYVGRYDEFARYLAAQGFVVCGHDHIGHGKSAPRPEDRGHMPADGGADVLVEDVHQLRSIVAARYARNVPYYLFGHSMGSFVARVYLTRHAAGLSGAVICGTGNRARVVSKAGNLLARATARRKGERTRSELLHSLADGSYSKAVKDARTPFDWLSADEANVDAFIADEDCGFTFTAGGYATLTSLVADAARGDLAARIPHDLPLLYIAGEGDPVGDNGKGVWSAATLARAAGVADVQVIVYPGMRHEILNEAGRDRVFSDVLSWLDSHGAPARP